MTKPDGPLLAALGRLLAIAQHDTGLSPGGADVLFDRWTVRACGSFGPTDLWAEQPEVPRAAAPGTAAEGVESAIAVNILAVMDLVTHHHEYPTACRLRADSGRLAELWRPALVQEPR